MLGRIAEILPYSISLKLLPLYVFLNKMRGKNKITYNLAGREIQYKYVNNEQFLLLYNMVDQGRIVAEDISLDYFQDLEHCGSFIDVGAYHGLYSVITGSLYDSVTVYAFEPNKNNRQTLTHTLETNGIDAEVRSEVVTDTSGEVDFYERNDDTSEGHSTTEYTGAAKTIKESVALSDFFTEKGIKNPYVKLDAEGEEYNILTDIMDCSTISSMRGIVEVHPDKMDAEEDDIIELFEEHGYDWEYLGDTTDPSFSPSPAYYFSS